MSRLTRTASVVALLWHATAVITVEADSSLAPPGHDFPLCSARSEQPTSFRIGNLKYSHEKASPAAHLEFDLLNNSNNLTRHCSMADASFVAAGGQVKSEAWTACDNADVVKIPEAYDVTTLVRFDRASVNLVVNQTWYCDDVNPEYPIGFHGTSDDKVQNFTCISTDTVENCSAPDFGAYLWVYDRFDLPPYALEGLSPGRS
ncbi:uncharacterized protein JN550_004415 [Neoarthrinium moseri]|uniref:uncharacterized protein n=1 Tax=Neoarthrinium moseri TaxID=1658444 RepID=UPI001FDACCAC|nr:uncharacterized protein JN550_004415 [Neoarthrinium moseri]KAI1871421.1 hypothetical protein JN550_004415 [Neoarthrinium moseri]